MLLRCSPQDRGAAVPSFEVEAKDRLLRDERAAVLSLRSREEERALQDSQARRRRASRFGGRLGQY